MNPVPFSLANPPPDIQLGRIVGERGETYRAQLALSRTVLEDFSPPEGRPSYFYQKHILRIPMEERRSAALDQGNSAETLILEGDEVYRQRYVVLDEPKFGDQRKAENKAAKEAWHKKYEAELKDIAEGKRLQISEEDHRLNEILRESVYQNPIAAAILRCCQPQISWRVRMPDYVAQCRTDLFTDSVSDEVCEYLPWLKPGDAFFADLKTTASLDKGAFTSFWKQWQDMRYYRQTAFYRSVIQPIIQRPLPRGVFIAVEKTPPYETGVFWIEEEDINFGERELSAQLELLKLCFQTNLWPGIPQDEPIRLTLKSWHVEKVMKEIEEAEEQFRVLREELTHLQEVAPEPET